jgi:hypothetical protein
MAELDEIISSGSATAPTVEKETTAPVVEQEASQSETTDERTETGDTMVPVGALQKEREKAKRYTEQVAAFEQRLAEQDRAWQQRFDALQASLKQPASPPPQAPEFWEAPEQAIDYRLQQVVTPIQQQLVQQREQMSRMMASEKHGESAVNEAYQALASMQGAPEFGATYSQIMSSPHPYGALVDWHRKQQVMSEIGSDPAAYKEKLKAEVLAEMQASTGQQQAAQPAPAMPSNFATARNVGSRSGPAWSGPTPLQDIFARR